MNLLGYSSKIARNMLFYSAVYGLYEANKDTVINGATGLLTYCSHALDREHNKMPDVNTVNSRVAQWAQDHFMSRLEHFSGNVTLKINDEKNFAVCAFRTLHSNFICIDTWMVNDIQSAISFENDTDEKKYNWLLKLGDATKARMADYLFNVNRWTLDHELAHIINNDYKNKALTTFAIGVITQISTIKLLSLSGFGAPKTGLVLIAQCTTLIVGGKIQGLFNKHLSNFLFVKPQEVAADDFANQHAQTAQQLKDQIIEWESDQKKFEESLAINKSIVFSAYKFFIDLQNRLEDSKEAAVVYDFSKSNKWVLRSLYCLKDPSHPMPADRATAVSKVLQERFGCDATKTLV